MADDELARDSVFVEMFNAASIFAITFLFIYVQIP